MLANDLITYVNILRRWRRFILRVVGVTLVASVIAAFLLPKWYQARSSIVAPQESGIASSVRSLMGGFSAQGLGGLGATNPEADLFLAVLDSRSVREKLIQDFGLQRVYKTPSMDDALKTFSQLARADLTDRGVVEVVVEDRDPQRAADIANAWVRALDEYNQKARMTTGKKTRLFVESRLRETKESLRTAEDALAAYERLHKLAPLGAGATHDIEASASVLAQRMALSVQLNRLTDLYRTDAPEVQQVRADLAAVDRQIEKLPPLVLEYARLLRDVKVQEQVYELLVAQYEEARIQETRDTPTIEVLDPARRPQRKVRPVRWLLVLSLTGAATILSIGVAFTSEALKSAKSPAPAGA
jgi:tyrosine-protein kinase Etk/Wzc